MSAQAQESTWNRDYIAFMRCEAGDAWMPDVEAQLSTWLREKELDVDVTTDAEWEIEDKKVTVRRSPEGGACDLKVNLVEQTPAGTFTTQLVAHDEPGGTDDWIHLSVTNEEGKFVDVPRLARYLLQVLPLRDGSAELSDRPRLLHEDDVPLLVETLADPSRQGLVLVAGTDIQIPLAPFATRLEAWSKRVYGLAHVVVLDPPATEAFKDAVTERFSAPPWTIRTYQPRVDLADPADSRRHRILGTDRLARQSDKRISYLLGDIARNHAAARELPVGLLRVLRRFERIENRRLVDALIPAPVESTEPPTVEPATIEPKRPDPIASKSEDKTAPGEETDWFSQISLVRGILKIEKVTESALKELASWVTRGRTAGDNLKRLSTRVDELQTRIETLEDRNTELGRTLGDEQMDHEMTRLDLDKVLERNRWLQAKLKERGDYEADYLPTPDEFLTSRPGTFDALLERIEQLDGVEFTGDATEVAKLSSIDTNESALRTAWDAVLALVDYAKARAAGDWDAGLDGYLKASPSGYCTFPPGKFAQTETAATMSQFGDERLLPVPAEVCKDECIEMKAHFKLARIGMASPRMHIYDGHPHQPKVYIGYIGTHLTNTMSS